jgi:hypothetical protein
VRPAFFRIRRAFSCPATRAYLFPFAHPPKQQLFFSMSVSVTICRRERFPAHARAELFELQRSFGVPDRDDFSYFDF